jgi:hypothetical protein
MVDALTMKQTIKAGLEKSWTAVSLLAAALLLSGAAIYNGHPLMNQDTSGYLHLINNGYRSVFYSLFIALSPRTATGLPL